MTARREPRRCRSCVVPLLATLSACGLMQSSSGPEHRAGESLDAFIQKRRLAEGAGLSAVPGMSQNSGVRGSEGAKKTELDQLLDGGLSKAEALTALAVTRIEQWCCQEAETLLRQIAKGADGELHAWRSFLLGRALRRQGRFAEALVILAPLSKRAWKHQVAATYHTIHVLRELGRFDDALIQFERLKSPEFAEDVKELGSRFIQLLTDVLAAEKKAGRRLPHFGEELEIVLRTSKDVELRRRSVSSLRRWKKPPMRLLQYALLRDEELSIRALAMNLMLVVDPEPWNTLVLGLGDREPLLRRKAASLFENGIPKDIALPRLFAALEGENDPGTFRQIHESLQAVAGRIHIFAAGAEEKPEERKRICGDWRKFLGYPEAERLAPPRSATKGSER